MKKLISGLYLFASVFATTAEAQTLFSFGKHQVSRDEFLQAFKKNNNGNVADEAAYRNYLDLYIRYKLKVQAAYDQQVDTLPSQRLELESFREQVAANYMYDQVTLQQLVTEAGEHSKKDIRISHIYIPYAGTDTSESWKRATAAMEQLKNGKSFEGVAEAFSLDPAAKTNKGDIGWISAFTLPYPLEKLAYSTPLQQVSAIYRGPNAYHLFKPTASRPAVGFIQVAQILLALPPQADRRQTDSVGRKADSLFQALQEGADFGRLALAFSADNSSYQNKGILPAFSVGTFAPEFEDQAVSLFPGRNYSRPFLTSQGYHILRKLQPEELVVPEGPEWSLKRMDEKVKADDRAQLAHEAVIEKVKKLAGFRVLPFDPNRVAAETPLALMHGKTITGKEYLDFKNNTGESAEQFFRIRLLEDYQNNLEKYEPVFAAQLNEFREGNLLFEMMQQMVWEKAGTDEEGLRNFYRQRQNRYLWKESVRGVIFNGTDSALMQQLYSAVQQDPPGWKTVAETLQDKVQADSGRFEMEQLPVTNNQALKAGMMTRPVRMAHDLGFVCLYIFEKLPGGDNRSFEEARGFVLNDYQLKLEEEWLQSLRKKYPVTVNKSVLKSLNR